MDFRRRLGSVSGLILIATLHSSCAASEARQAAKEGGRLYDRGDYAAALPLLEKAAEKGLENGELFYQLGYLYSLKSMPDKSRTYLERALPLLEKEAGQSDATLLPHYYLAATYLNLGRSAEMQQAARRGVERFQGKTGLTPEDEFRLGRIANFASRGDLGAAAYRRAVEGFSRAADPNPILYALALEADAQSDLQARRYAEAAGKLNRAGQVNPQSPPSPFVEGVARLGARDYAAAVERFGVVREESRVTEAQYGADIARHLAAAGGAEVPTIGGKPLPEVDNALLEEAIRTAAGSLREARRKAAEAGGTPQDAQPAERAFFTLTAEWMLRGNPIREMALSGGFADLIRR